MHRLPVLGMVHHGGRSVSECGPIESKIGGVIGLFVSMTQKGCISACLPIVTMIFWSAGISILKERDN
jgi:hypothetical protein